jgi:hypothetical protein
MGRRTAVSSTPGEARIWFATAQFDLCYAIFECFDNIISRRLDQSLDGWIVTQWGISVFPHVSGYLADPVCTILFAIQILAEIESVGAAPILFLVIAFPTTRDQVCR